MISRAGRADGRHFFGSFTAALLGTQQFNIAFVFELNEDSRPSYTRQSNMLSMQ
jgi:hypothetical protein